MASPTKSANRLNRATPKFKGATFKGPRPLYVVDLFCGAGGISEGFRQAGFQVRAALDNDPDALATFAKNFPDAEVICGDIRKRSVKARVLEAAKNADVLVGGPPCQAFSQVRNHSRIIDDPRNSLYREFIAVLRHTLPAAFVVENVTGMDQMGVRDQIRDDLSLDNEYAVQDQVVDAADFGVPQTRKRLIFIGVRRGRGMTPPNLHGSSIVDSVALTRFTGARRPRYQLTIQQHILSIRLGEELKNPNSLLAVSAAQAISDLAGLPVGNRADEIDAELIPAPLTAYQRLMRADAGPIITNVQVPRINRDTELRLKAIPQGGNYRDLNNRLLERYLTGQRWGQDNGSGKLSRKHFYAYRRLHPDIWAWTLNTKADSVYHYEAARALSIREFARLQSFPDAFAFTTDARKGVIEGRHEGGPAHSRYRQVGNAVPPLLAKQIASLVKGELFAYMAREEGDVLAG